MGSGSACSSPTGGCATHPLRRCTATGGSRRSREEMDANHHHRGRRTVSALGSRAGQTGKATRRERITRVCSGRPPGMAQRRTNGHRGLGQHRYGDVTGITGSRSSIEQCRHFAGRDHSVDYPTRATDRNRGRGPRPRSAARRRGPESAKEVTVAAGEPTPTAGGVVPPEKSIATFWTRRHSRRFTSLRLLPPASRVFAVCRIAPTDCLPLPAPQGRRSGAGVMGQAAGWGGGGRRWWWLR
jgi:hypothetical protein